MASLKKEIFVITVLYFAGEIIPSDMRNFLGNIGILERETD